MLIPAVLVVLIVAILVWRMLALNKRSQSDRGRKRGRTRSGARQDPDKKEAYRAVSINYGLGGCGLVEALVGKRFLVADTPQLPLNGCRQARCHCKFQHHAHRRDPDGDRRFGFGLAAEVHERTGASERRGAKRKGRRKTDQLPVHG
ncbi:MAG: hypothetical protein V7746_02555 [Halioglobus sp.]